MANNGGLMTELQFITFKDSWMFFFYFALLPIQKLQQHIYTIWWWKVSLHMIRCECKYFMYCRLSLIVTKTWCDPVVKRKNSKCSYFNFVLPSHICNLTMTAVPSYHRSKFKSDIDIVRKNKNSQHERIMNDCSPLVQVKTGGCLVSLCISYWGILCRHDERSCTYSLLIPVTVSTPP